VQNRAHGKQAGGLNDKAGVADAATELGHRDAADRRAEECATYPGRGGDRRVPRREAQASLQEDVEDEHDATHRPDKGDREEHSEGVRAAGEDGQFDQRSPAVAGAALFDKVKDVLRPDADVHDISLAFELVAAVKTSDRQRTEQLRRRYLAVVLDGLRATGRGPLPGPPPTWHDVSDRWVPQAERMAAPHRRPAPLG
jgi:hypothetical protein